MRDKSAKPKLLVFIARPGAGKTTLIKVWRQRHRNYRLYNVYPYMMKLAYLGKGIVDYTKRINAYRAFYQRVKNSVRTNAIVEIGISLPDFNLEQLGRLTKPYDIKIFFLLRHKRECFRLKNKQRGAGYHPRQLMDRMRWPFPSVHRRLAGQLGIQTHIIMMYRGYPAAIRSIDRALT